MTGVQTCALPICLRAAAGLGTARPDRGGECCASCGGFGTGPGCAASANSVGTDHLGPAACCRNARRCNDCRAAGRRTADPDGRRAAAARAAGQSEQGLRAAAGLGAAGPDRSGQRLPAAVRRCTARPDSCRSAAAARRREYDADAGACSGTGRRGSAAGGSGGSGRTHVAAAAGRSEQGLRTASGLDSAAWLRRGTGSERPGSVGSDSADTHSLCTAFRHAGPDSRCRANATSGRAAGSTCAHARAHSGSCDECARKQ